MATRNINTTYRPSDVTQNVPYTGTAGTIANPISAQTFNVRVYCTTDAFVKFGVTPTATTADMPVAGGVFEYFSVNPGEKISAIQSTANGTLYVTEMTQ